LKNIGEKFSKFRSSLVNDVGIQSQFVRQFIEAVKFCDCIVELRPQISYIYVNRAIDALRHTLKCNKRTSLEVEISVYLKSLRTSPNMNLDGRSWRQTPNRGLELYLKMAESVPSDGVVGSKMRRFACLDLLDHIKRHKIEKPLISRLDVEPFLPPRCNKKFYGGRDISSPLSETDSRRSYCYYGLAQVRFHVTKSNAEKAGESALALFLEEEGKKDRNQIEVEKKVIWDEEKQKESEDRRAERYSRYIHSRTGKYPSEQECNKFTKYPCNYEASYQCRHDDCKDSYETSQKGKYPSKPKYYPWGDTCAISLSPKYSGQPKYYPCTRLAEASYQCYHEHCMQSFADDQPPEIVSCRSFFVVKRKRCK
jgi:hypothetical protein